MDRVTGIKPFEFATKIYTPDRIVEIAVFGGISFNRAFYNDWGNTPVEWSIFEFNGYYHPRDEWRMMVRTCLDRNQEQIRNSFIPGDGINVYDNEEYALFVYWCDVLEREINEASWYQYKDTETAYRQAHQPVDQYQVEVAMRYEAYLRWITAVGLKDVQRNFEIYCKWTDARHLLEMREVWTRERLDEMERGKPVEVEFDLDNAERAFPSLAVRAVAVLNDREPDDYYYDFRCFADGKEAITYKDAVDLLKNNRLVVIVVTRSTKGRPGVKQEMLFIINVQKPQ